MKILIQSRCFLNIRELIGAVHSFKKGTVTCDQLIMRAAALKMAGEGQGDICRRFMRQLGFDDVDDLESGNDDRE